MNKIRTAVVGLNLGSSHARAFHQSEQAELKWVVDLDEARAAKFAEELGCQYTTRWQDTLDDVDAISFCTPHHLHASQALEAIAAGKHVLLEKPLANSEEECLQIIQAAEEKDVTLMLAFIVRYLPHIRRLKQAIETEEFGKPFNAHCWVEAYLKPNPESWFSQKDKLGGGVLFSHGCHYVDILQWLLGKPVSVTAMGTRLGTEWMQGEGTSHSVMQFESGALAHLVTSWGMKYKEPAANYQIHFPEAVIVVKGFHVEVVTAEGRRTLFDPAEYTVKNLFTFEIEHFLDCIRTGKKPETDGQEGLKSHRMIWDMYKEQERYGVGGPSYA